MLKLSNSLQIVAIPRFAAASMTTRFTWVTFNRITQAQLLPVDGLLIGGQLLPKVIGRKLPAFDRSVGHSDQRGRNGLFAFAVAFADFCNHFGEFVEGFETPQAIFQVFRDP